jgi:hypothetical protein
VKIPSLGVTQHFADQINWVLDLVIGIRLPPLNDNSCTNHITCRRYVKLHVLWGFGATRVAGLLRYIFKSSKASYAS